MSEMVSWRCIYDREEHEDFPHQGTHCLVCGQAYRITGDTNIEEEGKNVYSDEQEYKSGAVAYLWGSVINPFVPDSEKEKYFRWDRGWKDKEREHKIELPTLDSGKEGVNERKMITFEGKNIQDMEKEDLIQVIEFLYGDLKTQIDISRRTNKRLLEILESLSMKQP